MSTATQSLQAVQKAVEHARHAARTLSTMPGGQQTYGQVIQAIAEQTHKLEAFAAQTLSAAIRRPIPMPTPDRAGDWISQMQQGAGALFAGGGAGGLDVGTAIDGACASFTHQVDSLMAQMRASGGRSGQPSGSTSSGFGAAPPPVPMGGSSAHVPVQPPAVQSNPLTGQTIAAYLLQGLAVIGAVATAYALYKRDQRLAGTLPVDPTIIAPREAHSRAQLVFDSEIPGAIATLTQSPTGAWVASAKTNKGLLARATAATAGEATESVIQQALAAAALRESVDGVMVDAGPSVEKPPKPEKKPRKPKSVVVESAPVVDLTAAADAPPVETIATTASTVVVEEQPKRRRKKDDGSSPVDVSPKDAPVVSGSSLSPNAPPVEAMQAAG